MGRSKLDKQALIAFIIKNIETHQNHIVKIASENYDVSKQTIYRYIRDLAKCNHIHLMESDGKRSYKVNNTHASFTYDLKNEIPDEEEIWRNKLKPALPYLTENVNDICHYGIGEMVNNVLDHSEASNMQIEVHYNLVEISFLVEDNGIGIFTKLQKEFDLEDKNHAILELAKGKLTTDPSRHSGEGIFFTSRMFDEFSIWSEDTVFHGHENDDWLFIDRPTFVTGTRVYMQIERGSARTMKEIFDRFTPELDSEDFGFRKTIVPVKLLQYEGESLVSRSQAKRLIARFDQFREVILDFKGVKIIGQPFADEVFRVFQTSHPDIHLYPLNTNKDIERMIKHVKGKPI